MREIKKPDKMSPASKQALKLWGREKRVTAALMLSDDPEAAAAEALELIGRLEGFELPDDEECNRIADKILSDQD